MRRGHRCGYVVEVLALDADEVEQAALAARYFVLPRPPRGAFEFDGHPFLPPLAVLLDAPWEVALAQRLGVGLELGVELALDFGLGLEKGAPRRHRCGDAVVVLAADADEVEQVALAARYFVLPCPARGAFEFDGHRVFVFALDSEHVVLGV